MVTADGKLKCFNDLEHVARGRSRRAVQGSRRRRAAAWRASPTGWGTFSRRSSWVLTAWFGVTIQWWSRRILLSTMHPIVNGLSDAGRARSMSKSRIGVCSWSLEPASGRELIDALGRLGIGTVQLALNPIIEGRPGWRRAIDELRDAGVDIASGMIAMAGEDYSTLESIRRTGGVRLHETWLANRRRVEAAAGLVAASGIGLVTFHAGFLPPGKKDPDRGVMLDRLRMIADLCAARDVSIGLETGQETAETLAAYLQELDRPNVGVNFDPANMILYGIQQPLEALGRLSPHVRQVHIKDALPAQRPGLWGKEVRVGAGAVNWDAFFVTALAIRPPVDFVIEREAGRTREADIAAARDLISGYVPKK